MLVEADAKSLEWMTAAFLSQDQVMLQELWEKRDPHTATALEFFGDIKFRNPAAKVFNFGYIYGRSVYGYMYDQNMPKFSREVWMNILGRFEEKYSGLANWHKSQIRKVNRDGYLINPTGRILTFKKVPKIIYDKGKWVNGRFVRGQPHKVLAYHEPHIKNYPVQSFATADLIPLWMVQIMQLVKRAKLNAILVMQVHDSLLFDVPKKDVLPLAEICIEVMRQMPKSLVEFFPGILKEYPMGVNIPLSVELKQGPNWGQMEELIIK